MATSSLPERTNWFKCSRLLIEGGRAIFKDFLKNSCSFSSLDTFLASCKSDLTVLRKSNKINSSQWDKLFPHSDIESLDITLLTCIISNFIIQPQSSQKIALDDIRDLRNSLYGHVCHLSMNRDEFMKNWQLICTALTRAQLEFGTNITLKDFIDTVKKEEIVNGDEWRTELEIWKRNDTLQEIQQTLEKHSSKISNIEGEVKEHGSEISQHSVKISKIEGEVKEHGSEISQHSMKISNIEGEVKEHGSEISQHRLKMSNIESKVKEHISEISNHSLKMSNIESKVKEHISEISNHSLKMSNIERELMFLMATIGQKRSFPSKGSSNSDSIKKKKSEVEVNIPALEKQDLSELQNCLLKYYTEHYMKSPVTAAASSGCGTDIDDIYDEPKLLLVNHSVLRQPTSDNKRSINLRDILLGIKINATISTSLDMRVWGKPLFVDSFCPGGVRLVKHMNLMIIWRWLSCTMTFYSMSQ